MRGAAIVIGGGFFGCSIALHLRARGFAPVTICEREPQLLARASYSNQARVHNGYHYPRSYLTAWRSRQNMGHFCREFAPAVKSDFTCLYAIAARRSKVMPAQYERFLTDIGASFERAGGNHCRLFEPRLVAAVYVAEEYAFDAARLREILTAQLARAGVVVRLGVEVRRARPDGAAVQVEVETPAGGETLRAPLVVNCTYARTNWNVRGAASVNELKHEIAEIALVDVPPELKNLGITVMDGPFFSCMPFPAEQCHSLSHVRYTPHGELIDRDGALDPLELTRASGLNSRADSMLADAARFVPLLRRASYRRSLFEVKTVLTHHEVDDGRPMLLRREFGHQGIVSVLGGKLDNVYDVLAELDRLLAANVTANVIEAA
jgi:glycine/D-amino acid oxidase-like deaminating enzyme